MATVYSTQYTSAFNASPIGKLDPKEYNGRVRRIFVEHVFAANRLIGDIVKMAKLPANSTIIQAELSVSASVGAGAKIDLGWAAGDSGSEAANDDGILVAMAADATTLVAMSKSAAGSLPAFNKKFSEPVDIEATFKTANAGSASGKTLRLELLYIID